jgi:phosphoribosylanthranilate isomerase
LAALALPEELVVWPVLREAPGNVEQQLLCERRRLLFEGPRSGTGKTADWAVARELAAQHQLILAGGLNPDNVAEAIVTVNPFGVDVSSGVEAKPGLKDPARIDEFVSQARAAFARAEKGA